VANARFSILTGTLLWVVCAIAPAHATVDVEAAKALAKANDCLKCHAADKDKRGPSMGKIAAKYKGVPDARAKAVEHMTTGPLVKLSDGSEINHKIVDSKDVNGLANIADWFLSH